MLRYNSRDFDWLKTTSGHKQEIDILVPDVKLAIEYDGEQHFMAVPRFGGEEELKQTKRRDKLKDSKIKAHPEDVQYFVRFSYKEPLTEEYVRNKLIEANVPMPAKK